MQCIIPASESEPEGDLEPPWWLGRDWLAEERRAKHADVARIVHVVQDVEGIQAKRHRRARVFLGGGEKEIARPAQVKVRVTRALQAVAAHTGRTVVRQPVIIVIAPSCLVVGLAGVQR